MARVSKVPVAARSTDGQIYTGSGTLMGFALREAAGTPAAATMVLRDGTSTAGDMIAPVNFTASQSAREWYGPQGIPFNSGIFWDAGTGTVEGVLYIG